MKSKKKQAKLIPKDAKKQASTDAPETAESQNAPAPAFPIVGIGASAGGLAAFEAFFSGLPVGVDTGMAFVLVQHLAPDHKSILSDLIRRYTRMKVFEVEDGMKVQPDCAYIIPPNRDMAFLNGTLELLEPSAPRGQRLPIDFFFRSLALDQRERAIGIVLSGTGSDGTLGIRAIKGEGGMVMAQTPSSTEHDGMPRSAIATGLVDYELAPGEMSEQIIAYVAHAFGKPPRVATALLPKTENALKKAFVVLRDQTGHDFSQYKPSTIHRRIERRMAVHQIETIDAYVKFLQQTPGEVDALFRDLLIGVTNFFRDPEIFEALETRIVPALFAARAPGTVVRSWTVGCSTGEEAYSLAILLQEHLEKLNRNQAVQVFATDIDPQAIATARTGRYLASIAADISPERLARFFTSEPGGEHYRIHRVIRDMLVFSEQDVIKDPPFSKLDMISCRNLLIYIGTDLQKKLIPLFHYALNPGGYLFLGSSESIGEFGDLFSIVDSRSKLYQRREVTTRRAGLDASQAIVKPAVLKGSKTPNFAKLSLRELAERALIDHVVAAGVLVNDHGDILYLHGRTGMYLEAAPGEAGINNVLKMAREGLRREMTTGLRKVVRTGAMVRVQGLRVKTNGHFGFVDLTIRPLTPLATEKTVDVGDRSNPKPAQSLFLVILEESAHPGGGDSGSQALAASEGQLIQMEPGLAALKLELQMKENYLQTAYEELESSNEERKSSMEEMQSVNEEVQSTNEELETSKEELQSVNEELATVNAELQTKVVDLSRANNDMNNLLAGTDIGTVFVDHDLRILRFTPAATRLINLIPSDVRRPLSHTVTNLIHYDKLVDDVQGVLETLTPVEKEVQTTTGAWFTMRILPYRTLDNIVEGAVITFVDITVVKRAQEELKRNEVILHTTQQLVRVGVWEWDVEKASLFWTDEMYRLHDLKSTEIKPGSPEQMARSLECYRPEDRPLLEAAFRRCVDEGKAYDLELPFTTAKGRKLWIRIFAEPVVENGKVVRVIGFMKDLSDRRRTTIGEQARPESPVRPVDETSPVH